jgi:hypothetical protein
MQVPKHGSQEGVHSFEKWRVMYEYILDCMYSNVRQALTASLPRWGESATVHHNGPSYSATSAEMQQQQQQQTPSTMMTLTSVEVDWEELRRRLERHVYATSSSRFKSYHPIW